MRRPLRSAIAVVAVASGVTLAVTVIVVQTSTSRSFDEYARSLSGPAPLRVIGPVDRGGLPEATIGTVESVEGVGAAVPLVQAVTVADGPDREGIPILALGYDCRIEAVVGDLGCSPEAIESATEYRPPLLSTWLAEALGPGGIIRSNLGPQPVRGGFPVEELNGVNDGRVVAFPIRVAQSLFSRPDGVDTIYVLPEEGVSPSVLKDRLQDAVGGYNTVLSSDETSPQFQFFTQLYTLLTAVGLGTLATGAVLVHNALSLSLEERRRDLAVAAALGGRPRTIVGGTLAEGAVLGAAGGVLGAGIGLLIAYPVLDSFQFFAERIAGLSMTVHPSPLPFVAGAGLGVALGLVAAIKPARRASRMNVVSEIQGRSARADAAAPRSPLRPVGALLAAAGGMVGASLAARGGAIEPWQPVAVQVAAAVSVVGFMLAIGQFAPLFLSAGSRLFRRSEMSMRLAWANLTGEGWRSAGMVLAAGGALVAAFMISNLGVIVLGAISDDSVWGRGDALVVATTPISNSLNLEAKPSPDVEIAIESMPGVASVQRSAGLTVGSGGRVLSAEGFDGRVPPYEVLRGEVDPEGFWAGEVVIGPGLARRNGIEPGDELRLPGKGRFVTVGVQGIVANGDNTGLEVSMPLRLLEEIWGPQPATALLVEPAAGVGLGELATRIEAANLDPHLQAYTPAEFQDHVETENSRFFAPFWTLQRALIAIAFAAVLSNLLLVAMRRKRELGLLAAVGMPSAQLGRVVVLEALVIGALAIVLGSLAALGATEAFRHALNVMIPYPMPLRIDVAAPFVYGAITLAVLVAAASLPAWRTARLDVVEALRYE